MENTHFVTPSGLDATSADGQKHHSTAYDMALLAKEALQNQQFREICSSTQRKVAFEEPAKQVSFTNHNKLLSLYPDCIGVKTGYTESAGRCLVSAAERDGTLLIAVTLDAPDDWNDHATLLDYGFSQVEPKPLEGEDVKVTLPVVGSQTPWVYARGSNGGNVSLPCGASSQLERRVLIPKFLYAPIKAGEQIGEIRWYYQGVLVGTAPITAEETALVEERESSFWERLFGKGTSIKE